MKMKIFGKILITIVVILFLITISPFNIFSQEDYFDDQYEDDFQNEIDDSEGEYDEATVLIIDGNILVDEGYLGVAYKKYCRAIEVDPSNMFGYINKAQVLYQMWYYEEAIEEFTYVIENITPRYDPVYTDRGLCYAYIGEVDKALSDWDRSIQLNPDINPCHYYKGALKAVIGQSSYREDMEKALKYVDDAYLYNMMAQFIGMNQHPDLFVPELALEYSTMANELTGWQEPELLYTFAEIYFQMSIDRETGEMDIYYIDKAIKIMDRIFDLQEWLVVERNGYHLWRYKTMWKAREQAMGSE